ncbi:helix-turn-helix transcriptional regulator (plasmid) [Rhodococcoides fascians]|uniref:helix-turn-helix domain-containing protein n=1 Tax=Nocardiaceae TaxID=85025 RepID=UPI001AE9D1A6|nr:MULTISPECIES: helix-turn-helix transcriptional regulator [Rhodococcus]MBP2527334.1 DNA-binding Xre family transcriptional regulator [Rhodococcus sp. PvP104]WQH31255.1 helix-turn-helix transcriptional regulator [Rhodococcus fascians]
MRRSVDYTWRLSELMAAAGMHNSTDLVPHLRERGIELSASQVYRLVARKPERVSLTLIAAVCDIFTCTPSDLVTVTGADQRRKKTASAEENVLDLNRSARPRRARVTRIDD